MQILNTLYNTIIKNTDLERIKDLIDQLTKSALSCHYFRTVSVSNLELMQFHCLSLS